MSCPYDSGYIGIEPGAYQSRSAPPSMKICNLHLSYLVTCHK